jgi:hypothetical protein
MTFENSLRLLAEKEPLKFKVDGVGIMERICFQEDVGFFFSDVTQDDIDAILAEIGWEYQIECHAQTSKPEWAWDFAVWTVGRFHCSLVRTVGGISAPMFPTKLEAAKAALIAVVERKYGEVIK